MNDRTEYLNFNFRVNPEERKAVEALCAYESVKLSEALRIALREACKARGLWPVVIIEQPQEDKNGE